jgi:hypothetical protein
VGYGCFSWLAWDTPFFGVKSISLILIMFV